MISILKKGFLPAFSQSWPDVMDAISFPESAVPAGRISAAGRGHELA
jgi:hypothetical protein